MTQSDTTLPSVPNPAQAPEGASWEIKVLFDGDCPLCAREIAMLGRLDKGRGRIAFEDLAAVGFDPAVYGTDFHTLMARIHGVLPGGELIEGVEVFRRAYAAVGLGWLAAPSRWPGLRQLCDAAYRVFARNRLRWTGREHACEEGVCGIAPPDRPAGGEAAPPVASPSTH